MQSFVVHSAVILPVHLIPIIEISMKVPLSQPLQNHGLALHNSIRHARALPPLIVFFKQLGM